MENINFKASRTQPSHLEVSYWIDLNEDPFGGLVKYYNTKYGVWEQIKAQSAAPAPTEIVDIVKKNLPCGNITSGNITDWNSKATVTALNALRSELLGYTTTEISKIAAAITALEVRVGVLETA